MNRIDRLTSIIIMLQSRRLVTASDIATKYDISLRTVYRDIRALEEAGVPIAGETGRGYYIVDGYHLPPVMFNTEEAGALLLAEKLCERFTDRSLQKAFSNATEKIKSILPFEEKEYIEHLNKNLLVFHDPTSASTEFPNHFLTRMQKAIHQRCCLRIDYYTHYNQSNQIRTIEPLGLCYYGQTWHLIAYCRLRNDYRDFRLDRIRKLSQLDEIFDAHSTFNLNTYFQQALANSELLPATIKVNAKFAPLLKATKHYFGWVGEEELSDGIEMYFLMHQYEPVLSWLMGFYEGILQVSPDVLKQKLKEHSEKACRHYAKL